MAQRGGGGVGGTERGWARRGQGVQRDGRRGTEGTQRELGWLVGDVVLTSSGKVVCVGCLCVCVWGGVRSLGCMGGGFRGWASWAWVHGWSF